jgi:hypothetical protein
MRHSSITFAALAGMLAATSPASADKDRDSETLQARLSGFNEVGALNAETGAILSNGTGTAVVELDTNSATYTLTYSGLGSNVTQAHIHFGKVHVPGGIMVFFCTNLGNGPAGTPACPAAGGTVTGTWDAASVVAIPGQNVTAGDFGAILAALGNNTAYANVHTVKFPAGEIRGQMRRHDHDDHD